MNILNIFVAVLLFVFVILVLVFVKSPQSQVVLDVEKQVCFKNDCFNVEVADTQELRGKGLMLRDHLDENGFHKPFLSNIFISLKRVVGRRSIREELVCS